MQHDHWHAADNFSSEREKKKAGLKSKFTRKSFKTEKSSVLVSGDGKKNKKQETSQTTVLFM